MLISLSMHITGWQLGEHAEWAKYSNFEVAVNVPLMFSVPGVTYSHKTTGPIFKHIDPLQVCFTPRT